MVRYKQTTIGIRGSFSAADHVCAIMPLAGCSAQCARRCAADPYGAAATLPWQFFASAFGESANSLIANSNLLTKVYFPRLILPLSTILVSLIDLFVAFVILLVLMASYAYMPGWEIVFLPVFLLLALVGALGSGLFIAALNVKYRDFRYVVPVIIQFGLYITPVAFSSTDIYSNPNIPAAIKPLRMQPNVASDRWVPVFTFRGSMVINWPGFFVSTAVSLIMVLLGVWYFRRTEKWFADVI